MPKAPNQRALRKILSRGVEETGFTGRKLETMDWAPCRQTISGWMDQDGPRLDQLLFVVGLAGESEAFRESFMGKVDPDYPARRERLRELEEENSVLRGRVDELERQNRDLLQETGSLKVEAQLLRSILQGTQERLGRISRGEPCEPPAGEDPVLSWVLDGNPFERVKERLREEQRGSYLEIYARVMAEWAIIIEETERGQSFEEPGRSSRRDSWLEAVRGRLREIRRRPSGSTREASPQE